MNHVKEINIDNIIKLIENIEYTEINVDKTLKLIKNLAPINLFNS